MPINFPSSPSTNDTYTYLNRTWKFNGEGWEMVNASGAAEEAIYWMQVHS